MSDRDNGWGEYRREILHRLDEIATGVHELERRLSNYALEAQCLHRHQNQSESRIGLKAELVLRLNNHSDRLKDLEIAIAQRGGQFGILGKLALVLVGIAATVAGTLILSAIQGA